MNLDVVITTYNRPHHLSRLLDDIEATESPVQVRVYDDASTVDHGEARARIARRGWAWTRSAIHRGLGQGAAWLERIHRDLTASRTDAFVFLADDLRLCRRFFDRVVDLWRRIEDPAKIALNVLRDGRALAPQWTAFEPAPCGDVIQTGWIDGAFFADRRYLAAVADLGLLPTKFWPTVSRQLHARGHHFYCAARSLVEHAGNADSVMHPKERRVHPLSAVDFVDDDHGFAGDAA